MLRSARSFDEMKWSSSRWARGNSRMALQALSEQNGPSTCQRGYCSHTPPATILKRHLRLRKHPTQAFPAGLPIIAKASAFWADKTCSLLLANAGESHDRLQTSQTAQMFAAHPLGPAQVISRSPSGPATCGGKITGHPPSNKYGQCAYTFGAIYIYRLATCSFASS